MLVESSRPAPYLVVFIVGEMLVMAGGTALSIYLRLGGGAELLTWKYSLYRILFVPLVLQISFYYLDLHNFRVARPLGWTLVRVIQAMTLGTVALAVVYYLMPRLFLGRGVLFIMFGVVTGLVILWRVSYGWALQQKLFSTKLLLLGGGSLVEAILEELSARSDNVYQVVCLVDLNPAETGETPDLLPFWARVLKAEYRREPEELLALARFHRADLLVVALDQKRGFMPIEELLRCRMSGLPVQTGEDFFESIAGRILAGHVTPAWLIFSPTGFTTSGFRRFSKRAFDLFFSGLGLVLAAPFMLPTALLVRLSSPGPVIYRQERVGQHGRRFTILKFRSMVAEAEAATGPVWSPEDDPRVTRVGRFIRAVRLDELPQLWNVFKGEMSFVGPRPERPHFVAQLEKRLPFYGERHNVKPGITGWAQVCYPYGSSEAAALEKLNYDLYYIKHAGLGTDLSILFQTLKLILLGGGGR